jgi:hypothetical protein
LEAKALAESDAVADRLRALENAVKEKERVEAALQAASRPHSSSEVPLGTLLKNYALVLLGDKRNMAILLLGAAVAYLAISMRAIQQQDTSTAHMLQLPTDIVTAAPMPNVVTATMTATSYSTLTVTESQTVISMQETAAAVAAPVPEISDKIEVAVPETILEVEDALPTSRAVELLDSVEQAAPVIQDSSNANHISSEGTLCAMEPVLLQASLAYCAAS